jgi:DNA topoisomerase-1
VQLGEVEEGAKTKPKRVSWPKELPLENADLSSALKLLSLPREVGAHPETGKKVIVNIGRFGPYIGHDGKFKSIPKTDSIFDIGLERCVELLAQAKTGGATVLRTLGEHPDDKAPIEVCSGRYGPYVRHGKINATLPRDMAPEAVTLEEALEMIAAKAAKGGSGKTVKKAAAKKAATSKKTKEAAEEKPAAKPKSSAKKATTKTAAKKPAVKKASTTKSTTAKTTAKKPTAKKPAAKKTSKK